MTQQRQCLLLLDLIADLVDRLTPTGHPVPANWPLAASAARRSGVLVTYVKVDFRPGYPEIAERNVLFGSIAERGRLREGTRETTLHPASGATPTDIVVTKRRVSAFAGSDLELILRAHDIDTLVLAGLITSGVVLATALDALDRDFRLAFLSDGCADPDEQLHAALMNRFFPTRGVVMTTAEWIARL